MSHDPWSALANEYASLCRHFGTVQQRCSQTLIAQQHAIESLQSQLIQCRAQLLVATTQNAWSSAQPAPQAQRPTHPTPAPMAPPESAAPWQRAPAPADIEASLVAADVVICQTGCLSHGDYWRVQDHCRRTGKTCLMVEQPELLRIVHLKRDSALQPS